MLKQTILWTALPNGSDGPPQAGTKLRLSAYISPRLWNSDPAVTKMQLNSFPDFLDWPAKVNAATFQVSFEGGPTLSATRLSAPARSDLWQALFKTDSLVKPFVFEDLTGVEIVSFPALEIHSVIEGVYTRAAIDPAYGGGLDLPGISVWQVDPDLADVARPTEPARPYHPQSTDRGPVVIDERPEVPKQPWWRSCLLFFVELIRRLLKALGILSSLSASALTLPPPRYSPDGPPSGSTITPPAAASAKKTAFDQLVAFTQPYSQVAVAMPQQPADIAEEYDFHSMVSSAGDYPALLRLLGLVVDLEVTLGANLPPVNSKVQVITTISLATTTTHSSPRTHYELGDGRFLTRPRPTGPEISSGLLRLDDTTRFRVTQTDIPSSGLKLQNMATNLLALVSAVPPPPNRPTAEGLPGLQTAGLSIVRPNLPVRLRQVFYKSYALNLALAVLDGSPAPAPQGSDPAPAPTDELYAEDVTRGYRIDVWDDKSDEWHSLCQRIGTYDFPDLGEAPLDLEDEGFVQMGSTEPIDIATTTRLRAQETLFTWDGWSLCAPRPGRTILPDHTTGDPANTAVTPFKMETSFKAKPGTLPRLRFGYTYKLRARVADLAGNSVFNPSDPAFGASQPQVSPAIKFKRFEPVSPPPMLLRSEPKEGESLERLVVRSPHDSLPADPAEIHSERHIAPPKVSQLAIERHRKFDQAGGMLKDQAAYDLASREAGTTTHRLNLGTGTLELIPGVQEVTTPEHTYWLQTGDSFDIPYLPDPYARGVLLLGLPGMASFEQIIEPDGLIVNKIPFHGAWPDPKPFRLRLVGIAAGGMPAQPAWDATDRLLTVQLPQGETVQVRISSYFNLEDLENQAVWGWTESAAPANLNQLRDQAVAGRSWLHLPYRTLVLVHAVQRPLAIPNLQQLQIIRVPPNATVPWRPIGDTRAILTGTVQVDAKSTGKLDFRAAWQDPFDDPGKPTFDKVTDATRAEMHVGEIQVEDPAQDVINFNNLVHSIGDTKYHHITYSTIATTRYREHFPVALTSDSQNLVRPTPAEVGTPPAAASMRVVDIPNNARPAAPKPLYILPTFQWSQAEAGDMVTHVRRGGGLRVYTERPWYSSGAGELLGALVRPAVVSPTSDQAEALKKYTSEWGMDPIWPADATAPLKLADFTHVKEGGQNLSIAELATASVHVAGYEPGFDANRKLWYCDIQLDPRTAYFPFVRLALARFQPISVAGAHLSPIALTDICQVVPHRALEYDLNQLAAQGKIGIKMSGPAYYNPQQERFGSPIVYAGVQKRIHADLNDELNWELLAGVSGGDFNLTQQSAEETIWEGQLTLPAGAPRPLRILLIELEANLERPGYKYMPLPVEGRSEMLRSASEYLRAIPGGLLAAENTQLRFYWRLVFADELIVT